MGAEDIPSDLMIFNAETRLVKKLGSDYPELSQFQQAPVNSVTYKARDGQDISAYLTLPVKAEGSKSADMPFIVFPHGGPYSRDAASFDYIAQYLASRGYGVMQMNFRGSQGYGRRFKEAGRKNWVLMQDDVEDGARWLIEEGYSAPKNMCIMGWSYGGYAALMGGLKNADLYKCAVSIAGVTDLQDMISDMRKYRFGDHNSARFVLHGFESRDAIKENSPVKRAEEMQIPVYLAHGTMDATVHFDQFTRMHRALKKSNADVTAVKLKGGNHSLSDSKNRLILFQELDAFLQKQFGTSKYSM